MITSISIKNFKAFSDTGNISLGALTLLTGINGRGKSSFLQTLLSLSQSIRNSDQHTLDNLLVNGEWVKLGNFIDIVRQGEPKNEPVRFSLETDATTDNRFELAYVTSSLPQIGELSSFKVGGKELFSEGSFRNDNAHATDNNFSAPPLSIYTSLVDIQRLYYVAVDRKNASSEEVYGINYSWPDKSGNNILNVIYGKGDDFQRELERKLSEIFDGATFLIKQEGSSLRLYMDSIDDGNLFRPVNVGYGYSYVLSLITCGMLAEKGEFIVVENPEENLRGNVVWKVPDDAEVPTEKAAEVEFQEVGLNQCPVSLREVHQQVIHGFTVYFHHFQGNVVPLEQILRQHSHPRTYLEYVRRIFIRRPVRLQAVGYLPRRSQIRQEMLPK